MAHHILVVDDDIPVRRVLTKILTRAGYGVVACGSAEEALVHLGSHDDATVLLTDHMMPGMRGDVLAETVRQRWPDVSCLIMSGQMPPGDACFEEWLLKPFSSAQLLEAVLRLDTTTRGERAC